MTSVFLIDTAQSSRIWDESSLDDAERHRAESIIQPTKREQWIRSRIALRSILADRLGIAPHEVALGQRNGKPYLNSSVLRSCHGSAMIAGDRLGFSLSRSAQYAVVAVGKGKEIGVDIERKRSVRNRDAKSARFFCLPEQQELQLHSQSQPKDSDDAFLKIWTAKEAWLKAVGVGITSLPVTQVCVSLDPIPRYQHVEGHQSAADDWQLKFFQTEHFIACLAQPKCDDQSDEPLQIF